MNNLTIEHFTPWLRYDAEIGKFYWIASPANRIHVGDRAGSLMADGYRQIKIKGVRCAEHRLAWLFETGEWPEDDLDHINGARADNRFENLRDATRRENGQNMQCHRDGELPGASLHRATGKWACQIKVSGRLYYLGLHETEQDAHLVYKEVSEAQEIEVAVNLKRAQLGLKCKE